MIFALSLEIGIVVTNRCIWKLLYVAQTTMEMSYTLILEPNCKAMAVLSLDEDYQERLLYDVKERSMGSMLRIERAAAKHYSFLCKDVPVSSFREQSLKVAAIRIESADKE